MINKERLLNSFIEMVKIYSPSKNEKLYSEFLLKKLKELNADEIYLDNNFTKYEGNAPVIFAKFKGSIVGEGITLCAHMDVIEPSKNTIPVVKKNIIKSNGHTTLGGDDKAGIASILETITCLKEKNIPHRDIFIIFTPCEEIGLLGSKNIDWEKIPKNVFPAKNMIVVDNAGKAGIIAHSAPCKYNFSFDIIGKKAHAGIEPEKGINSILIASEIISNLPTNRINKTTTSNISKIFSDFASNVVPDYCSFEGEIRGHCEEEVLNILENYKNICDEICKNKNATFSFKKICDFPVLKPYDNLKFANSFKKIYESLGVDSSLVIIGGGSDSNIFANKGFNSIIIGVGMYDVHTTSEYLNIDDLFLTTKALIRFLTI